MFRYHPQCIRLALPNDLEVLLEITFYYLTCYLNYSFPPKSFQRISKYLDLSFNIHYHVYCVSYVSTLFIAL